MMDNQYLGLCLSCKATKESCEPDADNYPCDECGEKKVKGSHWLIIEGLVCLVDNIEESEVDL